MSCSPSRTRYDRYGGGGSRRRRSPLPPVSRRRSRSRRRSPRRSRNRRERSRDIRRSRSRSRSHSKRSSLSYSPVRRNPDRYSDVFNARKSRDIKSNEATKKSKSKTRSISQNRKPQVITPRVSLRSSSEDEANVDDDEPKLEDEERMKEINTLKRLQSGLAAKARETLGKKVISPIKIKIEAREDDNILDIALPAEPPKTITIDQTVALEQLGSKSPVQLNRLRSVESSRSPSPALPLTREEASVPLLNTDPQPSVSPILIVRDIIKIDTTEPLSPINAIKTIRSSPKSINPCKTNSINKNEFSRSPSQASSDDRTIFRLMEQARTRHLSSSREARSRSHSSSKEIYSPKPSSIPKSASPVTSMPSRGSRSSSKSKNSVSRSDSRSKIIYSRSPKKTRSRSRTRSASKRSRSRSSSIKSRTRSRSASRTSKDKEKVSRSRSSSRSSRRYFLFIYFNFFAPDKFSCNFIVI